MIRLELPVAVPQRLVIVTGRGRVPAPRSQADLGDFISAISSQRPPIAVCTRLAARDGDAGDAGSSGRCILDRLKAHGLIDGGFRRLTCEWAEDGPGECAEDGTGEWAEDGPGCVVLIRQTVAA
jgi:hypothetical protein